MAANLPRPDVCAADAAEKAKFEQLRRQGLAKTSKATVAAAPPLDEDEEPEVPDEIVGGGDAPLAEPAPVPVARKPAGQIRRDAFGQLNEALDTLPRQAVELRFKSNGFKVKLQVPMVQENNNWLSIMVDNRAVALDIPGEAEIEVAFQDRTMTVSFLGGFFAFPSSSYGLFSFLIDPGTTS